MAPRTRSLGLMSESGSARVAGRLDRLAFVALLASTLPVALALPACVLFAAGAYCQAFHFVALPLSVLAGLGLGSVAMIKSTVAGGRLAAVLAMMAGGLSAAFMYYAWFVNAA